MQFTQSLIVLALAVAAKRTRNQETAQPSAPFIISPGNNGGAFPGGNIPWPTDFPTFSIGLITRSLSTVGATSTSDYFPTSTTDIIVIPTTTAVIITSTTTSVEVPSTTSVTETPFTTTVIEISSTTTTTESTTTTEGPAPTLVPIGPSATSSVSDAPATTTLSPFSF